MKSIPVTKNSLALRTDFSDDSAWQSLCKEIDQPVGDFRAHVDYVSDSAFDGLTAQQVVTAHHADPHRTFAFLIDRAALFDLDHPLLVVDLRAEPGRTFRVIPSEAWGVENNLSLGNMDFADFADAVGNDGVFRGFPSP
jgi:hypothetical protein